jgi:polysaccharide pyruvyl transferase WcaK-like protein
MKLVLAGASPDTGNLGVSALCHATVAEILRTSPDTEFVILDHGSGVRRAAFRSTNGTAGTLAGAKNTRRYWRADSFAAIRLGARAGGVGAVAREICSADAILDISGGDSFTDLYGPRRLETVMYPKLIALDNRIPLVLLPQTYGPFSLAASRRRAAEVVRSALCAYARDEYSFGILRDLLGDAYSPDRHECGVDVAFLLPVTQPAQIPAAVQRKLEDPSITVAGLNVSGLIYNDPAKARSQYGISLDYRALVPLLIERLLDTGADVVWLIPHVLTPVGHYESDLQASLIALESVAGSYRERVDVLDQAFNQSEAKWVISRCDWFCGTRMHSTIAGLSSGVPTAALAYSGKTAGVFASVGAEHCVVDARKEADEAAIEKLAALWLAREDDESLINANLRVVADAARQQVARVIGAVRSASGN